MLHLIILTIPVNYGVDITELKFRLPFLMVDLSHVDKISLVSLLWNALA